MKETDIVFQSLNMTSYTMILCFSGLFFIILRAPVCDIKIWGPQKIAEEFVRPRKIAEVLWDSKKQLEKFLNQKNRIWSNIKPRKIGRASPSKFWHLRPLGGIASTKQGIYNNGQNCWDKIQLSFVTNGISKNTILQNSTYFLLINPRYGVIDWFLKYKTFVLFEDLFGGVLSINPSKKAKKKTRSNYWFRCDLLEE